MANWTVDEVGEWLKKNHFDFLVKSFKERNIDGTNLLALTDNMIEEMISRRSHDDEQNKLDIERFKYKLNKWKMQQNTNMTKRIQRPNSASRTSVDTSQTTTDTETVYERTLTITTDHPRVDMRFFRNPLFCETMKRYLSKNFRTTLSIKFKEQELIINLVGNKQNVKDSLDVMKTLFQSKETKIYNSETTDKKAIYWSKHIFSSSAIEVIQQIMNNERIFTIWEKTEMFSGYYKVLYFKHDLFGASPENIVHLFDHEIDYVENIPMPNEKTKNFMKELQKFIVENRQAELAIIQHKYPNRFDVKVSLFGRKKLVKMIKKKLQLLINKHTLKKFEIKMTSLQYEHLIDNCFHQLKDLERKYSDDGVVIRIRQKEFYAPQYLIDEVKYQINGFICQSAMLVIRKMGDQSFLTDEDNAQLTQLVKKYGCRIDKLDSKVHIETIPIPKALTKSSVTSNVLIEQSNQFLSSLSVRQLSLPHGSIEIHRANRSTCLTVSDVTVISTDAGATEEHIHSSDNNMFFGTKSGRKILFKRWIFPSSSDIETQQAKQKRSVIKFIASIFEDITNHCPNATTVSFSTNDWQNFSFEQQSIKDLLVQIKQVMETRESKWRILFLFDNNEQTDLYNKFSETMKQLQNNDNHFARYACSCQEIEITITTSKEYDLSICEREINNYIQKHLATTETLSNANDLANWDQHMINAFHKYCLDRSVIVNMDLISKQLCLTGTIESVNKSIEKYRLLCEIFKLKSSMRIPPTIKPRASLGEKQATETSSNRSYNIAFSYSQQDQSVCHHLLALLISENYQICQASSSGSISKSRIDRSDVLLVYFSENYFQDTHCMTDVNYAQSLGKIIVPIAEMKKFHQDSNENNSWLQSMTITGLFYDVFNCEIELEFIGDFDLEYDKLLSVLLRYTKPGVTGQQYEQIPTITETKPIDTEYEEPAFGHVSFALQKLTKTQRKEKEKVYHSQLKKHLENKKIPDDELSMLVGTLTLVVDDLEATLREEIIDDSRKSFLKKGSCDEKSIKNCINDFLVCIKRWMDRAPNAIKKNIAPFTPTGDINDALFLVNPQTTSFDWINDNEPKWHNSPAENGYFSLALWNTGSWFTNKQAHDCFQQMIKASGRRNLIYTTIDEGEVVWNTNSLGDATVESNTLGDEIKSPQEMQKLKELDDMNNLWVVKKRIRYRIMRRIGSGWQNIKDPIERQNYFDERLEKERQMPERFFKQKVQNAIEFKKLCETWN